MAVTPNRSYPIIEVGESMKLASLPKLVAFAGAVDTDMQSLLANNRLTSIVATGITTAMFATNIADTDALLAANSATRFATQSAVKSYVDNRINGLAWKTECRAATTANITLSAPQTIDDVAVIAGDRVLVKNQTTASQNGIYVVAAGAWTRATDADADTEMRNATVVVSEGTVNAETQWTCSTNAPITLGTTNLTFVQANGPGTYTATGGITLTGTSFALTAASNAAYINGLTGAADRLPYFTSVSAMALATFTATGRSVVGAASAAAAATAIGLGTGDSPSFAGLTSTVGATLSRAWVASNGLLTITSVMPTSGSRSIVVAAPATDSATDAFVINTGNSLDFQIDGISRLLLNASGNTIITGASALSNAGLPLRLTNTTNTPNNQGLIIESVNTTRAANDNVYASFMTANDAGTQVETARLTALANNVTAGATEAGQMCFGVRIAGVLTDKMVLAGSALSPMENDGLAIGTTALGISDIFLASGAVINANNGNGTLTHSAGLWTSNVIFGAPNIVGGYTTTVSAASTTALTVTSTRRQFVTGTTTHIFTLPVVSTAPLALGHTFEFVNNSTGAVTVNSSGGNAVVVIPAGGRAIVECILLTGTTAASWAVTRGVAYTSAGYNFDNSVGIGGAPTYPLDVYTGNGRIQMRTVSTTHNFINSSNNANNAYFPLHIDGLTLGLNANSNGLVSIGTGGLLVGGKVAATGAGGFSATTYAANARNPIYRFDNADGYGISYFQGTSGYASADSIGFHFGTATTAGSVVSITAAGVAINQAASIKLTLSGGTANDQNAIALAAQNGGPNIIITAGRNINAGADYGFSIYDNSNSRHIMRNDSANNKTYFVGELYSLNTYFVGTGSGANMVVDSNGAIMRSVSSEEYKKDIASLDDDYVERTFKAMDAAAIWYGSKCANDNKEWHWPGFSAERMAKGAPHLVQFKTTEVVQEKTTYVMQEPDAKTGIMKNVTRSLMADVPRKLAEPKPDGVDYARGVVILTRKLAILERRLAQLEQAA